MSNGGGDRSPNTEHGSSDEMNAAALRRFMRNRGAFPIERVPVSRRRVLEQRGLIAEVQTAAGPRLRITAAGESFAAAHPIPTHARHRHHR